MARVLAEIMLVCEVGCEMLCVNVYIIYIYIYIYVYVHTCICIFRNSACLQSQVRDMMYVCVYLYIYIYIYIYIHVYIYSKIEHVCKVGSEILCVYLYIVYIHIHM